MFSITKGKKVNITKKSTSLQKASKIPTYEKTQIQIAVILMPFYLENNNLYRPCEKLILKKEQNICYIAITREDMRPY